MNPQTALEKIVFDRLPQAVQPLFDGNDLVQKSGFVVALMTVDDALYAHTSLLGVGELFAPDSRIIRFALWPQSRAARQLSSTPRATMSFVHDGAFFQLRLRVLPAHPRAASTAAAGGLAWFEGQLEHGESQRVHYARLTSGISFELAGDVEAELARWQAQVDTLRHLATGA